MSFSHHTSFPCHFLMALISSFSFLDCGREMSVPIVRTDAEILLDHLCHKQYCKKPSPQFLMYLENTLNSQELGTAWIKLLCSKNCNTWKKDNLNYSGQFSQSLVQNISSQTIGIDCSPCCNIQKKIQTGLGSDLLYLALQKFHSSIQLWPHKAQPSSVAAIWHIFYAVVRQCLSHCLQNQQKCVYTGFPLTALLAFHLQD